MRNPSNISVTNANYKLNRNGHPLIFNHVRPLSSLNKLMLNGTPVASLFNYRRGQTLASDAIFRFPVLLLVLKGSYRIKIDGTIYKILENQMALIHRNIDFHYDQGSYLKQNECQYIHFYIQDDLLKEFIALSKMKLIAAECELALTVNGTNHLVRKYTETIISYFKPNQTIEDNLLRLKMLELLYTLTYSDENILQQLLKAKSIVRTTLSRTVEDNLMKSLSLSEIASLSGRSLSSFKREFHSIYKMPPSQWIRQKRLEKAKELVSGTSMSMGEITSVLGFQNLSHFSRVFKTYFGLSPTEFKNA